MPDLYPAKPKREKPDYLFSRVTMRNIREALRQLSYRWINVMPMPNPTLEEAYNLIMTDSERDILDKALMLVPARVTLDPNSEMVIPTQYDMKMAVVFMFQLPTSGEARFIPEHITLREDHYDERTRPLMNAIQEYADHKAMVTRKMAKAYHMIEYLNLACGSLRELRVVWGDFADMFKGMTFPQSNGKNWVPIFQDRFNAIRPGRPPALFDDAMKLIFDVQGYVAQAQLAVKAEDVPQADKRVTISIARDWAHPRERIPWHDEIAWDNPSVQKNNLSREMDWMIR